MHLVSLTLSHAGRVLPRESFLRTSRYIVSDLADPSKSSYIGQGIVSALDAKVLSRHADLAIHKVLTRKVVVLYITLRNCFCVSSQSFTDAFRHLPSTGA